MAVKSPKSVGNEPAVAAPEGRADPGVRHRSPAARRPEPETRAYSCERLNQCLADSQILYGLYKKHHWLMRGPTFYQLHLLLDKHAGEQLLLIDSIAERVQTLGGVAIGDPRHVAEVTTVPRPPDATPSTSIPRAVS